MKGKISMKDKIVMNDKVIGLVGFIILCALIYLIIKTVSHEILVGLLVGLVPSGLMWYSQKKEAEKEHRNWLLRDKKGYLTEIIDIYTSHPHAKGTEEQKLEKLIEKVKSLRPAIIIWGSPSMLWCWDQIQLAQQRDTEHAIKMTERLLREIRKEMGHNDTSLKPGAIFCTLVVPEDKQRVLEVCKDETYGHPFKNNKKRK